MKRVIIELDFDDDDFTTQDVYEYLKALMEDGSLNYEVEGEEK